MDDSTAERIDEPTIATTEEETLANQYREMDRQGNPVDEMNFATTALSNQQLYGSTERVLKAMTYQL